MGHAAATRQYRKILDNIMRILAGTPPRCNVPPQRGCELKCCNNINLNYKVQYCHNIALEMQYCYNIALQCIVRYHRNMHFSARRYQLWDETLKLNIAMFGSTIFKCLAVIYCYVWLKYITIIGSNTLQYNN